MVSEPRIVVKPRFDLIIFLIKMQLSRYYQKSSRSSRGINWRANLNGIDVNTLANLNMAVGNIRNIILNTSFLAADQDVSVGKRYPLQAFVPYNGSIDPATFKVIWLREEISWKSLPN